ncbi:MAG: MFS transporter [Rickettsiaceae bacterium]|nr:MFS transporter [Rickettsiaceae bacterium]
MKKFRIIAAGAIANIFEWYDYSLFGSLAYILGQKFFSETDSASTILNSFMVFAVGYLMRPFGGIFFGILGDKFGRKFSLSLSVILMSIPTAAIGLIPTYDQAGIYASIFLVLIRLIQGLSMGGALTGSISFLIEHTDKDKRGLIGSVTMSGICIGLLLGSFVAFVTRESIGASEFESWGWRIPFLLGIFNMFAGFYIIKYTEESPEFAKIDDAPQNPLFFALQNNWHQMVMSIFINSIGSILFYSHCVFVPNFLKTSRGFSDSFVDILSSVSMLNMAIFCIFSGYISDRIGRVKCMKWSVILCMILIFAISLCLEAGYDYFVVASHLLLGVLTALYLGPEPALQAEFYPANVRSTALSVSYNTSTTIFGGTTPLIIAYLYYTTNSLHSFSLYILMASILSLIGLYFYKLPDEKSKTQGVKK